MSDLCPNCGNFVTRLNNVTGFCKACSGGTKEVYNIERYLEVNADEIEHHLMQGKSVNEAIDCLHSKNGRSNCMVCGTPLSHAPRTAVFCRAKKECRRFARRYVYLYSERGMTKSAALAKVLEELT